MLDTRRLGVDLDEEAVGRYPPQRTAIPVEEDPRLRTTNTLPPTGDEPLGPPAAGRQSYTEVAS